VRRILVDATAIAALFTAGFIAGVVLRPGAWQIALDAWLLALGAVALSVAVAATRTALPGPGQSPFDRRRRKRLERPARLPELARVEREVALGTGTAFDAYYRLRPVLRDVAEHRLATRRGLVLDSGSDAVREALGEEAWELVRPDRGRPSHQLGPGATLRDVRAAIEALERI
jgi:hypothetical protein